MTIDVSPAIAANGLVFYFDEKNRYRSYLGMPKVNVFGEPNNFSGASWTKTNTTASFITNIPSFTTPSRFGAGALDAVHYLVETSATGQHYAAQSLSLGSGLQYTISVYAKAGERSVLWLNIQNEPISSFNLANGTFTANGNVCEMTYIDNGWYRCSAKITSTATSTRLVYIGIASGGVISYTGTAGYGIYLRQAQFELGGLTQHVTGTRTATNNCYDLISTAALTANNMSFDETGAIFTGAQYAAIDTTFDVFGNDFTLDTWSKKTSTIKPMMIAGRASPFIAYQNDNSIQFASFQLNGGYVDLRSTSTVTNDEYHHISCTNSYNTDSKITTMTIYIDGKADASTTFNGTFYNIHSGFDFAIGSYYTGSSEGYNLEGSIPNVKIYNRALSAEEVYQNYLAHREVYT